MEALKKWGAKKKTDTQIIKEKKISDFENLDLDKLSQSQPKSQDTQENQENPESPTLKAASLEQKRFGRNYHDPQALEAMVDNFFMVDQSTQTIKNEISDKQEEQEQKLGKAKLFSVQLGVKQDLAGGDVPLGVKSKDGKFEIKCPHHIKKVPYFFCIEPDCKENVRVMCEQCILEGPHRIHDHKKLQDVLEKVKNGRYVLEKELVNNSTLGDSVKSQFDRIKLMFQSGIELIKDHFFNELLPELSKLEVIQSYLENSKSSTFKKKFMNKELNQDLFLIISDQSQLFYQKMTPDKKKIDKFFEFFNDRIQKLEDICKNFIRSLLPNFMQEINYIRYEKWADEIFKKKQEDKLIKYNPGYTKPVSIELQGQIQFFLSGHTQIINDIKRLDEETIASCSHDKNVIIWNTLNPENFRQINPNQVIKRIQPLEQNLLAMLPINSQKILIYDYTTSLLNQTLTYKDLLHSLYYNKNKQQLFTGSQIGDLVIFGLQDDENKSFKQIKDYFKYSENM